MKKATLLLLCGALVFCACRKDPVPEPPAKDAELTGEKVDIPGFPESAKKLFVLNEGGMGSNNASLDFLRVSDGNYITGAFKKMNPTVEAGLGDVGNDIAVLGDEVWIVVNNSGLVEVISAKDETEIATIQIPTPRNIAFDDQYAYVTSWAGAYVSWTSPEDSKNPKGQVYKIDQKTKKVIGSVEVGYQPEGIAYYGGKLFVANSGGISSQLPPDYSYDRTVSVISTSSFTVTWTQDVEVNLKNVYSDGKGNIYVTSLGNYGDIHSGLYVFSSENPSNVGKIGKHVSCSSVLDDTVYCIGTEDEFNWEVAHTYYAWAVQANEGTDTFAVYDYVPLKIVGTPYGMTVVGQHKSKTTHYLLVGDAGDYFNPGTVSCYQLDYNDYAKLWSVEAGVCPGHFALY